MAMSVGGGGDDEPMMDINTTPLIDVMLVLLIMFIITLPVMTHAVKLDMPQAKNTPPPPVVVEPIQLEIDWDGTIIWNGTPVQLSAL
jgi:biopolymer transport protein ExbD